MSEEKLEVGDDVWLGVDLGRVLEIDGERVRVLFDRHPDEQPPTEGTYNASELRRVDDE